MAKNKILAKITMLSAGSAAPYDSAVVGLTTWDQDLVVGGVTYLKGRIIALSKAAASSGDASRGQGGYASPLELSLTIADRCAAGRLWPLVEAGAVPLVGAEVRILNESGDVAPQTWYLHEPKLDGASIKFTLKTMRYLCTKPVSWSAVLGDKTATVGLAVGDAAAQDLNAAGRYKGVSVPTGANSTVNQVYGKTLTAWNYGNPASPIIRHQDRLLTASEVVTTNIVANATTDSDGNRDFWNPSRIAFAFDFKEEAELDDFWNNYIGYDPDKSSQWSNLQPNVSLIISDGTNSETIIRRDENGAPRLGDFGAPIAGVDQSSVPSKSVIMLETSDGNFVGTAQARKGTNNIDSDGNTLPIINEPLLFAKSHTKRSVTFGIITDVYTLFIAPIRGGQLSSISDPENVSLYISKTEIPVCLGATSVVGFQKNNDNSNSVATIVVPPGVEKVLNSGLLTFTPTIVSIDGFYAWADIDLRNKIALYAYSAPGLDFSALFEGNIKSIVDENSYGFAQKILCGNSAAGGDARIIQFAWKAKLKESTDIGFTPDYLFVDHAQTIDIVAGQNYTRIVPMLPFISDNSDYSHYVWAKYNPSTGNHDIKTEETYIINLWGKGERYPSHIFESVKDLNNSPICQMMVYANSSNAERSAIARYQSLHIYAITKLAFGSNPAVVVPGNFPGTSNPTTTPAMAIDQLAAWAALSVIQTGGWTPPSGVWGRYLGPDPSSSDSTDPLTVTQAIDKLSSEAWMWVAEGSAPAAAPTIESMTPPVLDTSSIDDVVTLPRISYCYAGTSAQFTAEIFKADESFDIAKGDGYFWGGWQEKDACHFSTSPGSAVLAMCQLEDCLAVVCADGYLRCSYDGGETWLQTITANAPTSAAMASGGGVMLATFSYAGATNEYLSADAGRTWTLAETMTGVLIFGAYYDSTTSRFWICGKDADGSAAVWYATYGSAWTKIAVTGDALSARSVLAVGDNVFITAQISGAWSVFRNTISGGGSIWAYQQLGSHTDWTDAPHLARWNGSVRIAIGTALWSSADLLTWTNSATPIALSSFATDGKIVSALGSEASGGNHTYYSRDQGATWRAVRISPEGFTWVSIGALTAIWDDNAKCFRFSGWGSTRLIALGDPSVLDIWLRCRASYLKTQTLHAETYDWAGVYDADVVVSMLLDAKDGIDTEYQQSRIDWMAKQARFATLKVEFADIVEQLSLTAFQRITIPRQRLEDSLLAGNVPTYGLLTKVEPDPMTGISTIEIIMPPL